MVIARLTGILALASFAAIGVAASGSLAAAPDAAGKWVVLARERHLAERLEWLRLGHWERRKYGGYLSPAEGDLFLLAPQGRTDPAAELEATLRGFFDPKDYSSIIQTQKETPGEARFQPPLCQFPARRIWLQRELGFTDADLPRQDCSRYERFREALGAKSATLVFSSYYLNNPSSAFGHSFLRLNKAAGARPGRGAELLDYGINYAAVADSSNPLAYAFKGLAGLFKGTFTSIPYYYKIREYNDFEARDLWEYDLKLDQAQIDFMVAHIWELGATYFRYYYLRTNCSFHVLGLLDVINPSFHLVDRLSTIVIPADTLKVINEEPGLVTGVHYRPSVRTQFSARLDTLSDRERAELTMLLESLETGLPAYLKRLEASDLPPESRVRILDIAVDYIDLHHYKELINPEEKKSGTAGAWKQELLVARSSIRVPSKSLQVPTPWEEQPQSGHGSRRISLGSGYHSRLGGDQTVAYRFALHDLSDPTTGYPSYAQIEIGGFRFRFNDRKPGLWLDDVLVFHVISLNPLEQFDQKLSWTVEMIGKRFYDGACLDESCFGFSFNVGGGAAVQPFGLKSLTLFGLGMFEYTASTGFPEAHLRPGVGPTAGLRFRPTPALGLSLIGNYRYRFLGGPHDASWTELSAKVGITRHLAAEVRAADYLFSRAAEGSIGLHYYY